MEFRVLGPVLALREGEPVKFTSVKARELLAVLLLAPGHRASHASVTRHLWPEKDSNANRIRQFSHQLRQTVPEAAVDRNEPGFCQIYTAPKSVDYIRFQEFRHAADTATNSLEQLKALRSALGEWRGTPLEDMPGPGFERKRASLEAELKDTTVACIRAELESGEALQALDRVTSALAEWPESEALLRLKLVALRTVGKDCEIEPLLARWERQFDRSTFHLLLPNDTERPGPNAADAHTKPSPSASRQLPMSAAGMVGRQTQLNQLALTALGRTPGRSRIAAISGMPGVGKTFLAVEAATSLQGDFPDGVLYVDLGGFSSGEPERHGAVLARFLNDLGVRPKTPTMDGMVSAYRSALADRAVLLVLDNARDEEHVRPLLPSPGASAAIVTSRQQLHGLAIKEGAELIDLAPLDRQDAIELLETHLSETRMRTAVPFIDDLVGYCAGVPLALRIMAARIEQRQPQALGGIVRDLRAECTRLRSLDLRSESMSMRLLLNMSHKRLSAPAARLFWRLAVHPGPTVSWAAVRAFDPGDSAFISDALDDLLRMSLVTEPINERYSLHDLVRVYAAEWAALETAEERTQLIERSLSFLLHNAWSCDRKLDAGRRLPIPEPHGIQVATPSTVGEAMSWFDTEYSTLTAALGLAGEYGLDRYIWLLSMTLVTFQWRSDRHLDAIRYLTTALIAVRQEGGPADIAMVHRMLAGTHRGLGDTAEATRQLRIAVRLSEDGGDLPGVAMGRYVLGVIMRENGSPAEALEYFTDSLFDFQQLSDALNQGLTLSGIGNACCDLGRYVEAKEYCQRSLAILLTTDDVNGQAHALFSLGRIRMGQSEHDAATSYFERALDLYRSLSYGSRQARTLVWLSDAFRGAGRSADAESALEQARSTLESLGVSDLDAAVERFRTSP
ncbi:AfsR/SARP family transcriptional regulator [Streptomyces murinus]|uniref:AfsR/SARP family transcriptional regulator n=1 Tax=Streptomyces murinus TaxID=33900 RepID=UPI0021156A34|nr:tetratricopeptide repeat protein [Streptomyces murinus]